jgi:hypothetical protein
MSSFANGTSVSADKSRQEVETLLTKFGASEHGFITSHERRLVLIGFKYKGIQIRMEIPLPDRNEKAIQRDGRGYTRSPEKIEEAFQGEIRRRWRCLALAIKAKMVSVEDRVTTFEREFLPYMVTDSGRTVAEEMETSIRAAMTGKSLKMLPPAPSETTDAEFTVKA